MWEAEFDQFSMVYHNLFKVIAGLVQSSLACGTFFKNNITNFIYNLSKLLHIFRQFVMLF